MPVGLLAMVSQIDIPSTSTASHTSLAVSRFPLSLSLCGFLAKDSTNSQDYLNVVATLPTPNTPVFPQEADAAKLRRLLEALVTQQTCRNRMYHGAADEWPVGYTPPEIKERRAAELKALDELEGLTSDESDENDPSNTFARMKRQRKSQRSRQIESLPFPPLFEGSSLSTSHKRKSRITSVADRKEEELFIENDNSTAKESSEDEHAVSRNYIPKTSQQESRKRRRIPELGDTTVVAKK